MEDDWISAVEEDGLEQRHHSPRGVVPCRQKAKLAQPEAEFLKEIEGWNRLQGIGLEQGLPMLHKMLIFKRGVGFSSSRRRNQVQPSAKVEQGIPCSIPAPTFGIDANLELIPQLESTPWNRFQVS